jgi:hypothetical protein
LSKLAKKIVAVHRALAAAELPHAFGGALALAWCTQRARGTIDIDVNVFVGSARTQDVFAALPDGIEADDRQRRALERDGQVRLWWGETPVDVFLDTTPFHLTVVDRRRWERFAGEEIPFLSCHDIAVFKAFFNRARDWADLEDMRAAGTLDIGRVMAALVEYLGVEDERVRRLDAMRSKA